MLVALMGFPLMAAQMADLGRDGIGITVDAEPGSVDVGRDFFVTVTVTAPVGKTAQIPDLRDRFKGFQVAEDLMEEPESTEDGRTRTVMRWRLVPEPCAKRYRLAPFVVTVMPDGHSFYVNPVVFDPPPARKAVEGEMEILPMRDRDPFSWESTGHYSILLVGVVLLGLLAWWLIRRILLMVKIHRMSPIERALYELDVLLKKGLPGRGFFKDFYVELTMVVRRYIERRHAVRAPNLTTEEFLRAAQENAAFTPEVIVELQNFLESSDMVKFAGVEATPEMTDAATKKARNYLEADSRQGASK